GGARRAADRRACDRARVGADHCDRALPAPEGLARPAHLPAACLRATRTCLGARSRDLSPGVRGDRAPAAGAPGRICELAVLERRAERLAFDPLPDPARDADGRASAPAAALGRLGRIDT